MDDHQPIRQKVQSIVKPCTSRPTSANVDTESHFYADLQLSSKILRQPDAQAFTRAFCSWEIAQKASTWWGANLARWRNDEHDRLWHAAETEMDPVKPAARFSGPLWRLVYWSREA